MTALEHGRLGVAAGALRLVRKLRRALIHHFLRPTMGLVEHVDQVDQLTTAPARATLENKSR